MASIGQSIGSTRNRDSDLPDPCGEKRELRRMVRERNEEIERLRGALEGVAQTTDQWLKHNEDADLVDVLHDLQHYVIDALDGGGDQS